MPAMLEDGRAEPVPKPHALARFKARQGCHTHREAVEPLRLHPQHQVGKQKIHDTRRGIRQMPHQIDGCFRLVFGQHEIGKTDSPALVPHQRYGPALHPVRIEPPDRKTLFARFLCGQPVVGNVAKFGHKRGPVRRLDDLKRQPVAAGPGMGSAQSLMRSPVQRKGMQIDHSALAQLVQAETQIQHQRQIAFAHLVEHRPRTGAPRRITKGPAQFRADSGGADRPAQGNPRAPMHAEHDEPAPVVGKQQRFVAGQRQGCIGVGL